VGRRHSAASNVMVLFFPKVLGLQIVGFMSIVERVLYSHHGQYVLGNSIAVLVCTCVCNLKPHDQ
jgi:hypothetical protein